MRRLEAGAQLPLRAAHDLLAVRARQAALDLESRAAAAAAGGRRAHPLLAAGARVPRVRRCIDDARRRISDGRRRRGAGGGGAAAGASSGASLRVHAAAATSATVDRNKETFVASPRKRCAITMRGILRLEHRFGARSNAGATPEPSSISRFHEWHLRGMTTVQDAMTPTPGSKTKWRLLVGSLPMLQAYVRRLVGNGDQASEVLQEVSVRMLATAGPDDPERYAAWARGVVRHVIAHDWRMRRRARAEQPFEEDLVEEFVEPPDRPRSAPGCARLGGTDRRRHRQRRGGAALPPLRAAGERQGAGGRPGEQSSRHAHAPDAAAFQRDGAGTVRRATRSPSPRRWSSRSR